MTQPARRSIPLSPMRRLLNDFLAHCRKVPTATLDLRMHLAPLCAARLAASPRPGWCTIFAKALATVAARQPELRRTYLGFPRPRLYEHDGSVAAVTVERRGEDEDVVLVAHLREPDRCPLPELDARLRAYKERPLHTLGVYRRAVRAARLPRPLRQLMWWWAFNGSGPVKARNAGTFGVTSTAAAGAGVLHLITPLATTLHYGLFDADGSLDVRLTFDHRVYDGGTAARALTGLRDVLLGEILAELRGLAAARAA